MPIRLHPHLFRSWMHRTCRTCEGEPCHTVRGETVCCDMPRNISAGNPPLFMILGTTLSIAGALPFGRRTPCINSALAQRGPKRQRSHGSIYRFFTRAQRHACASGQRLPITPACPAFSLYVRNTKTGNNFPWRVIISKRPCGKVTHALCSVSNSPRNLFLGVGAIVSSSPIINPSLFSSNPSPPHQPHRAVSLSKIAPVLLNRLTSVPMMAVNCGRYCCNSALTAVMMFNTASSFGLPLPFCEWPLQMALMAWITSGIAWMIARAFMVYLSSCN